MRMLQNVEEGDCSKYAARAANVNMVMVPSMEATAATVKGMLAEHLVGIPPGEMPIRAPVTVPRQVASGRMYIGN